MIITFTGTMNGNNSAKKAALLTAGLLSFSNNKSVCALQINNEQNDMVDYMIGKGKQSNAALQLNSFGTEIMKGLDALLSKAGSMSLTKEHIYTACDSMIDAENRLDIIGASKTENFDNALKAANKMNSVMRILDTAEKLYDYVVVYVPHTCTKISDIITRSNVNVCCVRQGAHEEPLLTATSQDTKNVFLVTHFDAESVYSLKVIKKAYAKDDSKAKFFAMPHNTQFKDACTGKDLRKWLTKNYNIVLEDNNYEFVHAMQQFVDYISGSSAEEEPEPSVKKRKKTHKAKAEKKAKAQKQKTEAETKTE